jgi:hypothetical protein
MIKRALVRATNRRFAKLYVLALALASVLLYLALLDVRTSVAEMKPAEMIFEAAGPARQEDLAIATGVLEQRFSSSLHNNHMPALSLEGNHLVVSVPAGVDPTLVAAEASRVGRVELVEGGTQFLTVSSTVQTGPRAIPDQGIYQTVLTSEDFAAARARWGDQGRPAIEFTLTSAGEARLAAHIAELGDGYYLCLVTDGRVVNCPILRTPLKDRQGAMELTGSVTLDDAMTLALLLRSGPLPVPLKLAGN